MDSFTQRQIQILDILFRYHKLVNSNELASLLSVSNKTIQSEIAVLKDICYSYGIVLESNTKGYRITRKDEVEIFMSEIAYKYDVYADISQDSKRAREMIIQILLKNECSFEYLSKKLFVSLPVLYKTRNEINKILQSYSLCLQMNKGKGMCITGDERRKMHLFAWCVVSIHYEHLPDTWNTYLKNTKRSKYKNLLFAYLANKQIQYTSVFSSLEHTNAALEYDLKIYENEEMMSSYSHESLNKHDLQEWVEKAVQHYRLKISDIQNFTDALYMRLHYILARETYGYRIPDLSAAQYRENSPVSYFMAKKFSLYIKDIYVMNESECLAIANIFQNAFIKYNRVNFKQSIALVYRNERGNTEIFASRIQAQYSAYIKEVDIYSMQEFYQNDKNYDLILTNYPKYLIQEDAEYNPLCLDEISLNLVKKQILHFKKFEQSIVSLCKKGCFQHISQSHVKEIIDHADMCIAYRGSSAYVIYSDAEESFMEFFVSKDSLCYEGNYFNKLCVMHIGKNDSLHLIGRPMRMLLQDISFLLKVVKIDDEKAFKELLQSTVRNLEEAIY